MKLDDALLGVTQLGIDTSPLIYFIEAHPHYEALTKAIFQRVADGDFSGITSTITVTEVLVQPYLRGDTLLQQKYRDLLLQSKNFEVLPVDVGAAERAAGLRARYRLRTPDALQIAVALSAGCEVFLTNDLALRQVTELRVIALDDLEL